MPKKSKTTSLRSWPADKVERWPIEAIHPYPRNARLHSDEQIDLIAASIEKYGFTAPLLVDEEGVLIYGHGRHRAAQKLGITDLPVCVAVGWSEEDKAAYRIADNQIALRSEWDMPMLQAELKELSFSDFQLDTLGFKEAELMQLTLDSVDANSEYNGMPAFNQEDIKPFQSLIVHFENQEEVDRLAELLGQKITAKTKSTWFSGSRKSNPENLKALQYK